MPTYLVLNKDGTTKSYKCKETHTGQPYLKVSNSYLDLTTNTTTGLRLEVTKSGQTYIPVQTVTTTVNTTTHVRSSYGIEGKSSSSFNGLVYGGRDYTHTWAFVSTTLTLGTTQKNNSYSFNGSALINITRTYSYSSSNGTMDIFDTPGKTSVGIFTQTSVYAEKSYAYYTATTIHTMSLRWNYANTDGIGETVSHILLVNNTTINAGVGAMRYSITQTGTSTVNPYIIEAMTNVYYYKNGAPNVDIVHCTQQEKTSSIIPMTTDPYYTSCSITTSTSTSSKWFTSSTTTTNESIYQTRYLYKSVKTETIITTSTEG